MSKYTVILIFRRLRDTGNFSIETSFDRMMMCFPKDSNFTLKRFATSFFSNGILPRIKGIIEVRRHRRDINHMTGDAHYLVFGLPGPRTILTIHDCGFMSHPNRLARLVLKWFWLDLPVWHCRYVTAVSAATKQDIIRYTGCDPAKVVVIPTIIADTFVRSDKLFNETCPRILHVGLAPNKNFEHHVSAVAGLECHFHVIGKLKQRHIELLNKNKIRYTSEYNISIDEMQRAYAECDILLFASTFEGFGMPILEAQAVGRAVVTSNISSMPDVAGEGAWFVDPLSVESIRDGVLKVIQDKIGRDDRIAIGFENVKRFSAQAVAREYEQLYEAVIH